MFCPDSILVIYRVVFTLVPPQFQYQKEKLPSSQSQPFFNSNKIYRNSSSDWLAVFFLVLKSGNTSEKNSEIWGYPLKKNTLYKQEVCITSHLM